MKHFEPCGIVIIITGVFLHAVYADTQDIRRPVMDQLKSLNVEPENDCGKHYSHYQYVYLAYRGDEDLENRIARNQGGIFSPYDKITYDSIKETDIEHIVARKQAHLSGFACKSTEQTKRSFVTDLNNLTLATPKVNRGDKRDKDAANYMPQENKCWFAATVIRVKFLYNLSIDKRERDALYKTVSTCHDYEMKGPE